MTFILSIMLMQRVNFILILLLILEILYKKTELEIIITLVGFLGNKIHLWLMRKVRIKTFKKSLEGVTILKIVIKLNKGKVEIRIY